MILLYWFFVYGRCDTKHEVISSIVLTASLAALRASTRGIFLLGVFVSWV